MGGAEPPPGGEQAGIRRRPGSVSSPRPPPQYEPIVTKGNEALVHHMEVFQCAAQFETFPQFSGPCDSKMKPRRLDYCRHVLAAWALGAKVRAPAPLSRPPLRSLGPRPFRACVPRPLCLRGSRGCRRGHQRGPCPKSAPGPAVPPLLSGPEGSSTKVHNVSVGALWVSISFPRWMWGCAQGGPGWRPPRAAPRGFRQLLPPPRQGAWQGRAQGPGVGVGSPWGAGSLYS